MSRGPAARRFPGVPIGVILTLVVAVQAGVVGAFVWVFPGLFRP